MVIPSSHLMKKSDLRNGMTVILIRDGNETPATVDMRLYGSDQPCLTFPDIGPWINIEPYIPTDEDIEAFKWDAESGLIRSSLHL